MLTLPRALRWQAGGLPGAQAWLGAHSPPRRQPAGLGARWGWGDGPRWGLRPAAQRQRGPSLNHFPRKAQQLESRQGVQPHLRAGRRLDQRLAGTAPLGAEAASRKGGVWWAAVRGVARSWTEAREHTRAEEAAPGRQERRQLQCLLQRKRPAVARLTSGWRAQAPGGCPCFPSRPSGPSWLGSSGGHAEIPGSGSLLTSPASGPVAQAPGARWALRPPSTLWGQKRGAHAGSIGGCVSQGP